MFRKAVIGAMAVLLAGCGAGPRHSGVMSVSGAQWATAA
jgi:hypothetical protein